MQINYNLIRSRLYFPVSPLQQLFLKWLCAGCIVLMAYFVVTDMVKDSSLEKSEAYRAAQDFVSARLIRPSTATFPPMSTSGVTVQDLGQHRYYVSGYVHSLNTFGNSQKSGYKCIIRYTGSGEWVYEKVVFE